jgi:GNAT superfamily N-acetyltransferase
MIRPATFNDLPRLIELGEAMHGESRFKAMRFSQQKVEAMLRRLMERGFVAVAERDGEIIGGFAGMLEEHWFSEDTLATDLALFVEPGRRGGFAAAALVGAFLDWARRRNPTIIDIGVNTGVRTHETARLFEKLGGQPAGLLYTWEQKKCA